MAVLLLIGYTFLRDPGNPGKCKLCDQGAKMSWDKRLLYPGPTWEMSAVPTALQGETLLQSQVSAFHLRIIQKVKQGCSGPAVLLP